MAADEQQTSNKERGGRAVADKCRQQQIEEGEEGIRRRQTCGDKERRAAGPGPEPGPMRRLNNQPQGEEGVRRRQTSGDSNEERRAMGLM